MTTPAWPATLPDQPLRGYDLTFPRLSLTTQMERGPAKKRRIATANTTPYNVTVRLTRAQVPILRDFWQVSLAGGVLRFDWTDPLTGNAVTFRFAGDDPPQPRQVAPDLYEVPLKLEVLP